MTVTVVLIVICVVVLAFLSLFVYADGLKKKLEKTEKEAYNDAREAAQYISALVKQVNVLESEKKLAEGNKEIDKNATKKINSISTDNSLGNFNASVELLHTAAKSRAGNNNPKASGTGTSPSEISKPVQH